MDHDFYRLFSHYWWLIFPLFWMAARIARLWMQHAQANRALDIIKTYADQGKEPPPELLKNLQQPQDWRGGRCWRRTPEERLGRAFLFAALACAFGFMAFYDGNRNSHHMFGIVLITAIFAALALSNLLSVVFRPRELPPYDKDGSIR